MKKSPSPTLETTSLDSQVCCSCASHLSFPHQTFSKPQLLSAVLVCLFVCLRWCVFVLVSAGAGVCVLVQVCVCWWVCACWCRCVCWWVCACWCVPPYAEVYYYEMIFCVSVLSEARGDANAAKEFILGMFLAVNLDPEGRHIFPHFTHATDTENIKRVFQGVREHVLEQNLNNYILM